MAVDYSLSMDGWHKRMNALASQAVSKAAANHKSNRGELSNISIQPAENGFTVSCSYRPKPKKGKSSMDSPYQYMEPETMVFESAKSAAKYVQETLAGHEAYESKDSDDDE